LGYQNWCPGEPNGDASEPCAYIWGAANEWRGAGGCQGKWDDIDCAHFVLPFVCEVSLVNNPTSQPSRQPISQPTSQPTYQPSTESTSTQNHSNEVITDASSATFPSIIVVVCVGLFLCVFCVIRRCGFKYFGVDNKHRTYVDSSGNYEAVEAGKIMENQVGQVQVVNSTAIQMSSVISSSEDCYLVQ
jgi:hypothetical protein